MRSAIEPGDRPEAAAPVDDGAAIVDVVVVVDRPTPAWQARAVERVAQAAGLRLAAVRRVDGPRRDELGRWRRAIERRLYRVADDPLAPAEALTPADAAASVDGAGLLVWLADAPAPDRPAVLRLVSGPHDEPPARALARAVHDDEPVVATRAVLGGPTPRELARTVAGVRPFSATLTAGLALWTCAELAARAAEAAVRAAAPAIESPATGHASPPTLAGAAPPPAGRSSPSAPTPTAPPSPGRVATTARAATRWARTLATRALYRRPWEIRVRRRRADPAAGWEDDEGLVRWRAGHVYADPILVEHAGRHHLLCEEIPAGASRGVISHVELVDGEVAGPPEPVLEQPHHLSYPHVIAHDGELLLVPETRAARAVELHRATDFPRRWERVDVLLEDVDAVDATLVEHDGRWWMLVAIAAPGASLLDELHAFHAPAPRGPWTPHAANPIVSDVRCARPAGPILRDGGRLLRPAQDGSRRYGRAVTLRAIDLLTPDAFAEREAARLGPELVPGARALHAYTRTSRYEAIDLRRRVPRLRPRANGPQRA